MKLEVGMYVRDTRSGIIKKINEFDLDFRPQKETYDFEKSSYEIIDLIEVGDIIMIRDFVDEACMIFDDIYYIQNNTQLLNLKNDLEKNKNKYIKSIVTKEQFESMKYEV